MSPSTQLRVVVELTNRGEDAYHTAVHLPQLPGLSFRKASVLEVGGGSGSQQTQADTPALVTLGTALSWTKLRAAWLPRGAGEQAMGPFPSKGHRR